MHLWLGGNCVCVCGVWMEICLRTHSFVHKAALCGCIMKGRKVAGDCTPHSSLSSRSRVWEAVMRCTISGYLFSFNTAILWTNHPTHFTEHTLWYRGFFLNYFFQRIVFLYPDYEDFVRTPYQYFILTFQVHFAFHNAKGLIWIVWSYD